MTYTELVSCFTQEQKEIIYELLERVARRHPYKVVGRPETYSDYNQGWTDALDTLLTIIGMPDYADLKIND
jgi:muconolactone delta-isomerase